VYHLFQKPNVVYQWDIKHKNILKTYKLGDGFICDKIKVSNDGRFTVIACSRSSDSSAKALLVDNQLQQVVQSLPVKEYGIYVVRFSSNSHSFCLTTASQTETYNTAGKRD